MALSGVVVDANVAYADQFTQMLPVAIPAVLGVLVAYATELVTKSNLRPGLKAVVAAVLSVLAGVVATVTYPVASGDWRADLLGYVMQVGLAFVVATVYHKTGATDVVQRLTWSKGIGPSQPDEIEQAVKARREAAEQK